MKPYPLVALNHFTVPVAISVSNVDGAQYRQRPRTTRTRSICLAAESAEQPTTQGDIPSIATTLDEKGSGYCWHSGAAGRILPSMSMLFDQTDFSVVVKNRAPLPKPWRWEIYRAGRKSPIECSSVYYETMT